MPAYFSSIYLHLPAWLVRSLKGSNSLAFKGFPFRFGLVSGALLLWIHPALAGPPVSLDGSTSSQILDAVTGASGVDCAQSCLIEGSSMAGGNLFHSFDEFNVAPGVTVTFDDGGSSRILTRVTGGKETKIEGLLQVLGNADLFLLNSKGIVIEEEGRLDISGSFIGSTADRLTFADGSTFFTSVSDPPLLTVSVPSGLGFQDGSKGVIEVEGNNSRPPLLQPGTIGKTLALLGDDDDSLFEERSHHVTAGGLVLSSTGSSDQFIALSATPEGWSFDFAGVTEINELELEDAVITTLPSSPGGGVQLHGKVELENTAITLESYDGIPSGEFIFGGETLKLEDGSSIQTVTDGGGGDITLLANLDNGKIEVKSGSRISTRSTSGAAGNISVTGREFKIDQGIVQSETADGGGNIDIVLDKKFELKNESLLAVFPSAGSSGEVGNIAIAVTDQDGIKLIESQLLASSQSSGANVSLISEGEVRLEEGAFISLNSGDGSTAGTGGRLTVEATQIVSEEGDENDNDIQVIGPAGNYSFSLSQTPQFDGFEFSTTENIRGNGSSQIQIIQLPASTAASPPGTPSPVGEPTTGPITLGLGDILTAGSNVSVGVSPTGSMIIAGGGTSSTVISSGLITVNQGSGNITLNPGTATAEALGSESEEGTAWAASLSDSSENTSSSTASEPVALSLRDGDRASTGYQARRFQCEDISLAQDRAAQLKIQGGRGGLPTTTSALGSLEQSLADLGSKDDGRSGLTSTGLMGDRQDLAMKTGKATRPSVLQEAQLWQISSRGEIQLVARGRFQPSPNSGQIEQPGNIGWVPQCTSLQG